MRVSELLCGSRYRILIQRYQPLSLAEERRLIALAQAGSKPSRDELVLRHINFVVFRLHRRAFSDLLRRVGEDLLQEAIGVLQAKVKTYDLDYRDQHGQPKPVKFVSYIWKRIDGFIVDSLREQLRKDRVLREFRERDGWSGSEDGAGLEDGEGEVGLWRRTKRSIFV